MFIAYAPSPPQSSVTKLVADGSGVRPFVLPISPMRSRAALIFVDDGGEPFLVRKRGKRRLLRP
jgi:hypothetical protein